MLKLPSDHSYFFEFYELECTSIAYSPLNCSISLFMLSVSSCRLVFLLNLAYLFTYRFFSWSDPFFNSDMKTDWSLSVLIAIWRYLPSCNSLTPLRVDGYEMVSNFSSADGKSFFPFITNLTESILTSSMILKLVLYSKVAFFYFNSIKRW